MSESRENRARYSKLKDKYVVDPHKTEDMSLTVNNRALSRRKGLLTAIYV